MRLEVATKVPVGRLRLDRQNPRLIGEAERESEAEIIGRLHRSAELDELLQSISANGYLDIEPLVVCPGDGEDLVVLEGNRRLSALRLLRDPKLADQLRIRPPEIDAEVRSTLDAVSVYPVANREKARAFLGFKHINGPARWNAYAKGKFAADWYRSGSASLTEIARSIGDRHDTIKRMVSAIFVLEQAEKHDCYRIAVRYSRKFNFSHLYTALGRSQFMAYLGLEPSWAKFDPAPDPVPTGKLGELRNVLVWIYGEKPDDEPVVASQNPDIRRLGEVLAHAEALHVLQTKGSLDDAHARVEAADKRLTASLIRARDNLSDASLSLRGYDGEDASLLNIAADVQELADSVHSNMRKKHRQVQAIAGQRG